MNRGDHGADRPDLLTADEAARYLACSASTFKRLVRAGRIPQARISVRVIRFRLADLEDYVQRAAAWPSESVSWPARTSRRASH